MIRKLDVAFSHSPVGATSPYAGTHGSWRSSPTLFISDDPIIYPADSNPGQRPILMHAHNRALCCDILREWMGFRLALSVQGVNRQDAAVWLMR